jgi:hypothetical protein
VLGRHDAREIVQVTVDELTEGEHDLGAADHGDVAPRLEGRARSLHGGVDVGRLGQQHVRLVLARGRVPDRCRARRRPSLLGAADPVLDGLDVYEGHECEF